MVEERPMSNTIKHPELNYTLSDAAEGVDIKAVHAFLKESYWAKDVPIEVVEKSIKGSHCFSLFDEDGEQVGFARIVTDHATCAYVNDVYVLEAHRGKGLARWLMETIMEHPDLQGLRRWVLLTADQHIFYQKLGFQAPSSPEWYMEKSNPSPWL